MNDSRRTQRVARLLRNELALLLSTEVSDPYLHDIVVTDVDMSPDLKNARVYFSSPEESTNLRKSLVKVVPFLRKKLGGRLAMRNVPALAFERDKHGEQLGRLMSIFDELGQTKGPEEVVASE